MKYTREYKKIAKRIAKSAELDIVWKDIEEIYGAKATNQLKKLAPADPLLLHDLMVVSHLNDGKTRENIKELLLSYTHKDWAYDMENSARIIKRAKRLYFDDHEKRKE